MENISVRMANVTDAELIASLSRETFYNAFGPANTKHDIDKFMNEVFTHEKLMAEVFLPDNIFLLAYAGETAAGYVKLRDNNIPETSLHTNNVIEIARIYTDTSQIGKGVGSRLMNECIAIAKSKNRDFIWLGVWENNFKAIQFYERFGFKKFGEHPFVLGDDVQTDWLMARKPN
jgi:ribosomal protein S18 acetylase RimI-like enzyme